VNRLGGETGSSIENNTRGIPGQTRGAGGVCVGRTRMRSSSTGKTADRIRRGLRMGGTIGAGDVKITVGMENHQGGERRYSKPRTGIGQSEKHKKGG